MLGRVFSSLVGLVILAALAAAVVFGLQWVVGSLQAGGKLGDALYFILAAIVAGLGWLLRAAMEQRQRLEARLAASKRRLYEGYLDLLNQVLAAAREGDQDSTAAALPALREFGFKTIVVASDPVVKAQIRFQNIGRIEPDDPGVVLPAVADILLALRKDIGFSETNLTSKQVLGVFINDIDTTAPVFDRWEKAKTEWDQKMGWTSWWQRSRIQAPENHQGQSGEKKSV